MVAPVVFFTLVCVNVGFTPASRRMPALLEVTEGPNGIQRTETMEEAGGDAEKEEVPLLFPSPRAKPKDDNGGCVAVAIACSFICSALGLSFVLCSDL